MGMFSTRQPRKFNRISIYADDRKERLDKLVREVSGDPDELPVEERSFKGKFGKYTPHAQRAASRQHKLTWPIALIIVVLLFLAWHYIITGKI